MAEEKKHALLSPSSAARWGACPGSLVLCKDIPDQSSEYAQEGTIAHAYAEQALNCLIIGQAFDFNQIEDEEMRTAVKQYQDYVGQILADTPDATALVEVSIPLENVTSEPGGAGTADCLIYAGNQLHIVDFKYGRGVKVEAHHNNQLGIYALGAIDLVSLIDDIERVSIHIVQPRLSHFDRWDVRAPDLEVARKEIFERGQRALKIYERGTVEDGDLFPTTGGCKFCRAAKTCPAIAQSVRQQIVDSFPVVEAEAGQAELKATLERVLVVPDTPEKLSNAYGVLDTLELWIKSVREAVLTRMKSGEAIPGYKLVAGKPGNRKWRDEAEAEAMLKTMRIKEGDMYDRKVISPTTAEKLAKAGTIGKRQWPKLQELITRAEGKPAVAPESDPRAAISFAADDFEALI